MGSGLLLTVPITIVIAYAMTTVHGKQRFGRRSRDAQVDQRRSYYDGGAHLEDLLIDAADSELVEWRRRRLPLGLPASGVPLLVTFTSD